MVLLATFNSTTRGKGKMLDNLVQQIAPDRTKVPTWLAPRRDMKYTIYHTPYSFRPFDDPVKSIAMVPLMNNFMKNNGFTMTVIHLSSWIIDDQKFIMIVKELLKQFDESISLHFEACPPTKTSNKTKVNTYRELDLLKSINSPRAKFVLDTAHMYSLGFNISEMCEVVDLYAPLIHILHLNGNINPPFQSDAHCRWFDPRNRVVGIELFIKYIQERKENFIGVCEVTSVCGAAVDYSTWEIAFRNVSEGITLETFSNSFTL